MNGAELKERIRGDSILDYSCKWGDDVVYRFLLFAYDDTRKGGRMVATFICGLPDEEVERMFEEFKPKYAQQQLEQDL